MTTTTMSELTDSPSDAHRIRLVMSRFIGGGYVFYFFASVAQMPSGIGVVAGWWTPIAVVLAFVPGWAMLAASFLHPREWTASVLPPACTLGYLVAIGLWFVAWNGDELDFDNATWLVLFPGLASLALVVGRWPWLAFLGLIACTGAASAANTLTDPDGVSAWVVFGNLAWMVTFSAVFVSAGIMAVRTGDVLDATRETAYRIAGDAAAQQARDVERSRYDALVHDRVLAVLLNVRPDGADWGLAEKARRAMSELDDDPSDGASRAVDADGLLAVVRATVANVDARIPVTNQPPPAGAVPILVPGTAAHALANAAAEAARNSVRHAGADAVIAVTVEAAPERLCVTVRDDGCGFDPAAVRPNRMGLAISVRDRMGAAGGRATVWSRPGAGTRIDLEWPS